MHYHGREREEQKRQEDEAGGYYPVSFYFYTNNSKNHSVSYVVASSIGNKNSNLKYKTIVFSLKLPKHIPRGRCFNDHLNS